MGVGGVVTTKGCLCILSDSLVVLMACRNFIFFQTQYHILPYLKTKENKIKTEDKIEPQHTVKFRK